jgi:hypothetical protein
LNATTKDQKSGRILTVSSAAMASKPVAKSQYAANVAKAAGRFGPTWFKPEIAEDDASEAAMLAGFDRDPLRRVRQVIAHLAGKDATFPFGTNTPSMPTYGNLPRLK